LEILVWVSESWQGVSVAGYPDFRARFLPGAPLQLEILNLHPNLHPIAGRCDIILDIRFRLPMPSDAFRWHDSTGTPDIGFRKPSGGSSNLEILILASDSRQVGHYIWKS
jgi:hypothetical protein